MTKKYYVTGQFVIEADDADHASSIVQNAVESQREHIETDDVNAELHEDEDDAAE